MINEKGEFVREGNNPVPAPEEPKEKVSPALPEEDSEEEDKPVSTEAKRRMREMLEKK